MANEFASDPWVIDTAVAAALVTGRVYIERIRWVGPTTIGHKAVVTDANDKVIAAMTCEVANKDQEVVLRRWYENGIKIPTRESGTLHLYRKPLSRN
jgi:hypothetical protein